MDHEGTPPHRHDANEAGWRSGGLEDIRDIVAADVPSEPVEWLLDEPRIPRRGITLITGYRKTTKTTFTAWLAAQATRKGEQVFMASQEDDIPSFLKPRLEAAGAELDLVRFPDEDDDPLRFPRDVDRLARYINRRSTSLVILDSLGAFVPTMTNPSSVRDALTPLARISRQHDCAIVFVHHFRKSGGKTAGEAMGGSGALSDVARAVYVYGGKPVPSGFELLFGVGSMFLPTEAEEGIEQDTVRVLAPLYLSAESLPPGLLFTLETVEAGMPVEVPRVRLLGETEVNGETLFAGWRAMQKADEENEHGIEQAATFVLHFLGEGAQTTAALIAAAKEAGFSQRTLERARSRLKVVAFQQEGKWWVKLPDIPDAPPAEWS